MTHYDRLIDSLKSEMYDLFRQEEWDDNFASSKAHRILTLVESFQSERTKINHRWRASD